VERQGATLAAMSGSGSAVFGLFETERKAAAAARAVSGAGRTAIVTKTLSRRDYARRTTPRVTHRKPTV
jgi:4-diphosphocytidyl-2-C-methyl-D-erythritol kinase